MEKDGLCGINTRTTTLYLSEDIKLPLQHSNLVSSCSYWNLIITLSKMKCIKIELFFDTNGSNWTEDFDRLSFFNGRAVSCKNPPEKFCCIVVWASLKTCILWVQDFSNILAQANVKTLGLCHNETTSFETCTFQKL